MIDRQVAWSDEELQEIAGQCVPAADEVNRLQSGKDAECLLFQRFCDAGHYQEPGRTRQGIYVVTPSGLLLASANNRSPERLARMLRTAIERWNDTPVEARRLDDATRRALGSVWRWEDEYPRDGLVLEVLSRDLPREAPPERQGRRRRGRWTERAHNRDWAWFTATDARSIVPQDPAVGTRHDLPRALVERLARFHLVDNVRGQTPDFDRADLEAATMSCEVTAIDATTIRLSLRGETAARVTDGDWPRSVSTRIRGMATWDRGSARFKAMELVAVGERSGRTRYNSRDRDPGPAPIGYVLQLAAPDAPVIAPSSIWSYGWPRR